jgi:1-acyl-sn-glycerol-3-phosphate acyltransferase
MKILRVIHTCYGSIVFAVLFLILLPFLLIPILFPSQFKLTGIINRWWARLLLFFVFIPFRVEYRSKLDRKNNTSFVLTIFPTSIFPRPG